MKVVNIEDARVKRDLRKSIEAARKLLKENLNFMLHYRRFYSSHDQAMMGERVWEIMFIIRDLENELNARSEENTRDT